MISIDIRHMKNMQRVKTHANRKGENKNDGTI